MTKLIVEVLDMAGPGSYRARQKVLTALAAQEKGSFSAQAAAMLDVHTLVEGRCTTDDGTPVADALDQLSAEEFDALIKAMIGEPVPNASAAS